MPPCSPGSPGAVAWTFSAPDHHFDYLAFGEQLFLGYDVTLDDGDGGSATQRVVVTGTNDAPTVGAHVETMFFYEDPGLGIGLDRTGNIQFFDPDRSDTHTITFQPQNGGVRADGGAYLGTFSLGALTGAAFGSSGAVQTVRFATTQAELEFLGEGQTASQFYDVTMADAHNSVIQTVEMRFTGDNNAPIARDDNLYVIGFTDTPAQQAAATPFFLEVAGDNSAEAIDRNLFRGTATNSNLGNSLDPSITVKGQISSIGGTDFYTVTLRTGEALVMDIDNTPTFLFDTVLTLVNPQGQQVGVNDDAPFTLGGGGSRTICAGA